MAETLQPCCARARGRFLARVARGIASYPVIKDIPCPSCRRIIQIRVYTREAAQSETAKVD